MSRSVVYTALLAGFVTVAEVSAQGALFEIRESESRTINEGAVRSIFRIPTQVDMLTIEAVQIDLSQPGIVLDALLPSGGATTSAPIDTLTGDVSGFAAIGLVEAPPSQDVVNLKGFWFVDGGIHAAQSVEGIAHLAILPGGGARLLEPPTPSLKLQFGEDQYTINGLNTFADEGLSIFTGNLRSAQIPPEILDQTLQAFVYTTDTAAYVPAETFLRANLDPLRPTMRLYGTGIALNRNEMAVLTRTPPLPLINSWHDDSGLRLVAEVDDLTLSSKATVPIGKWLLRNGKLEPELQGTLIKNAVALDRSGMRLIMLTGYPSRSRSVGIAAESVADLLVKEGYRDAAIVGGEQTLLYAPGDAARSGSGSLPPVRLALVARVGAEQITAIDGVESLQRVNGIIVEGSRSEFVDNQPRALLDQKIGIDGALNHFWAARLERGQRLALRFRLPVPQSVAMIDMIHAENAGFDPRFNLKSYRIEGRPNGSAPWQELLAVNHAQPTRRERLVLEGSPVLAELRLVVEEASFIPEGDVVRLVEMIFWGPGS